MLVIVIVIVSPGDGPYARCDTNGDGVTILIEVDFGLAVVLNDIAELLDVS